ncbi:pyridoxamine 5'-phosphate oxidase family protein [Amycolatopsis halotolerans]|uniref:Pyridoxamine 5'-phosphate oxidase family protein n=1 Tax=Amycolatopsis halotolerans TaxID=330083 RepID=A0ABV7QCY2_9PSEU
MTERTLEQRQQDARHKLETEADVWLASADTDGNPALVPFSLAWDGERIILTTDGKNATARNLAGNPKAKLFVGDSRDVVLVSATAQVFPQAEAPAGALDLFADRTGWDARGLGESWVVMVLTPDRVQVWRGPDEIKGRTVMRDGKWLESA